MAFADGPDVVRLRDELVDKIIADRAERGAAALAREVEHALREVPRHLFVPGVGLAEAYIDDAVVTNRGADGLATSSVSQPTIIATMLDQLGIQPGERILEIGSGGYNAALMYELTGPKGSVVTMDIDPAVTDRATAALAKAGYDAVTVLTADGEFGAAEYGPFDRIIVTVGAGDIPPAWWNQLAEGGRLVVPLRMRGLTRSLALERIGDRLVSASAEVCGFVPMQGAGESRQRQIILHSEPGSEVALRVDNTGLTFDPALSGALARPRVEAWTGVGVGPMQPFDSQDLWLARLPEFSLLTAKKGAADSGLVKPTWLLGTPALSRGGTVAYRTLREVEPKSRYEFGVIAHGPHATALAEELAEQIRVWDRTQRYGPGPTFTVHLGHPTDVSGDLVIDRDHTRVSVTWP